MNKTDSIFHLKVSNTFSKFDHTVNQNTKSLTLTPTSFFKINLFLIYNLCIELWSYSYET